MGAGARRGRRFLSGAVVAVVAVVGAGIGWRVGRFPSCPDGRALWGRVSPHTALNSPALAQGAEPGGLGPTLGASVAPFCESDKSPGSGGGWVGEGKVRWGC